MSRGAMDERDGSVASSADFYESTKTPATPQDRASQDPAPAKRKADELESSQDKKRKLKSPSPELTPCAGLSPAIWQHIFLYCPLKTLGRLLQVNRSFHTYLTAVRAVSNTNSETGFLRLLKSDSIWASARNMHHPKPPKPLPGFSEVEMWRFVWSKQCQFCGKQGSFTPGEKIWQKGPGATGVRIIWPFGIRSCGPCLLDRCQSDSSLLFSAASAVRPAIPFAFITSDQHYIAAYTLQAATTPANVEIIKYYYKPHVDDITKELEHALSLGPSAAEEWSKGLDARGKERMKTAENWERWEVNDQWREKHQKPQPTPSAAPSPASTQSLQRRSPPQQVPSPVIHAPSAASKSHFVHSMAGQNSQRPPNRHKSPFSGHRSLLSGFHSIFNGLQPPAPALTTVASVPPYLPPRPTGLPPHVFTPQPLPGVGPQPPRGERNKHDANEAKANRKLEIERRAQLLNPPIPPNILRHMESFKAAIQISQPMNDYAWRQLYPRLLAQLPAAQQAESDYTSRIASLTTRAADRRQQDAALKDVKEVLDREWEEAQRPVRDRLSAIADDFINRDWDHGRAVTYENSPGFAADLLMYVRKNFYDELSGDDASREIQSEGFEPARHKLVLENMKWVYDNKLKPLTEQFRKELFLCNGEVCEAFPRFYGFEGVIQHFGAKHTNTFSVGNVIVAWREAEWPEEPPFHPDPISVKHAHANHSYSNYGSYYSGYTRAGTATPHVQSHLPQASPAPYNYGGTYNGPFAPPHALPQATSGYEFSQTYGAPPDAKPHLGMGSRGHGAGTGAAGYMASPGLAGAALAHPGAQLNIESTSDAPLQNTSYQDGAYRTDMYDKQVSTVIEATQDIWKQTAGIKDFPNSLRVYVLLHRVISKFHSEFNHEPDLSHFIDALSSHEIPRALKNAPGLFCKACEGELSHHSSVAHISRQEARKTYTVLNLFSHFQSQHSGQGPAHGNGQAPLHLDWKEDMIELPSDRFISGLIHAPGMDDDKLLMIATVFPRLFPTPLPRIGGTDGNGIASPAHSTPKDAPRTGPTSGVSTERSGASPRVSPYTDSPRPARPNENEYDPQRPALAIQGPPAVRAGSRLHAYHGSPPTGHRTRYYEEPRFYVGSTRVREGQASTANASLTQLPQAPMDDYARHQEFVELAPTPRILSDAGPEFEDYPGRRTVYRDQEVYYQPAHGDVYYTRPRGELHPQEYEVAHPTRYLEDDSHPQYRIVRETRPREHSPSNRYAEADRFLEELAPPQVLRGNSSDQNSAPQTTAIPTEPDADPEDGSRYSPPPPAVPPQEIDPTDPRRGLTAAHRTAPSTVSNGSRQEERRPGARPVPTPDLAGAPRRTGPHRRRDRAHDYVPSRSYNRYMSVVRDEPYIRGASMSRSHSRRYERYEEQRRRIGQQETARPRPDRDHDAAYSRDQSVDQTYPDDPYQAPLRMAPREYIPIQDRHHPYASGYRVPSPSGNARGPPAVYVDEFGQPLTEVEIVRVPRDHRHSRPPYPPARLYQEHGSDHHVQYVPYDAPPPRHDGRPGEYVYYEREQQPLLARNPAFEPDSEASYEPPSAIKLEGAPAAPGPEGH